MPVDYLGYLYAGLVASGGTACLFKDCSFGCFGAGLTFGTLLYAGADSDSGYTPKMLQLGTAFLLAITWKSCWNRCGKLPWAMLACFLIRY